VLRWSELGLLVAVGALALAFQLSVPRRLPAEEDYRNALAYVADHRAMGDVVLLHPWWTERARLFAPEDLPVVGYEGSDGDDLTRFARIWLVSQPELPGSRNGRFERAFAKGRTAAGEPRKFGKIWVQPYLNGRHAPLLFSLAEAIPTARVHLESRSGERVDCPWDGRAHVCPGGPSVADEWHEIRFEPRRCVWMPPPSGQRRLVVELPAVPPADRLSLEGGLVWDRGFFHSPQLTATWMDLRAPGAPSAELALVVPAGVEGVQRAQGPGRAAGPRPLELSVWAQNPELRDLCVDLFAYGEAPEVRR